MKRTLLAVVLLVAVGCTAPPKPKMPQVAQEVPFAENFERDRTALGKSGWGLNAHFSLSTDSPREGRQCLQAVVPDATGRYAVRFIPVEAGKFYKAHAWIRCKDVKRHPKGGQNRGAVIFCQWADHKKQHVSGGTFPMGLHGTHAWTLRRVAYTRRIPPNVGYIQLLLGIEGAGTAWFDDVHVEELTEWEGVTHVSPAEGAEVTVRRPLLRWRCDAPDAAGYRVELSRSPALRGRATATSEVSGSEFRPKDALRPGTWYWRVTPTTAAGPLPTGTSGSFVVPRAAPVWPPVVEPRWGRAEGKRPVLEARVGPKGAARSVAAWVNGQAAEIVSFRRGRVRFRPASDLAVGIHSVKLVVRGEGDRSHTTTGVFCNKTAGSRVTIRDDSVLLVDGKPFFPLGAYRDPSDTLTDFSGLKEAGFNVTHNYVFEDKTEQSPDTARRYLAAADRNGIKVFLGFHRPHVYGGDWAWCQRWAAELMDCPGLLTWYLMDEPAARRLPATLVRECHDAVKAVDPFHPTSVVYCRPDAFKKYAPCSDIFWSDPYPVPNRPLAMVDKWTRLSREAAGPSQPVWMVLQAHDLTYRNFKQAVKELGPPIRPSCQETRCMAFLALANGATGLIWYWSPNRMYHLRNDAPKVWKGLCDVVHELNGLMPYLVARRTADPPEVPEPFRTWSRRSGGQRVLAIVNSSAKPATLHLDLGHWRVSTLRLRRTGKAVALLDGKLTAAFEPHEVRVYEWQTRR